MTKTKNSPTDTSCSKCKHHGDCLETLSLKRGHERVHCNSRTTCENVDVPGYDDRDTKQKKHAMCIIHNKNGTNTRKWL